MEFFNRIPYRAYLFLAVTISAAAGAVTRQLINLGAQLAAGGHNPISFCNVLFVGNLCALLLLFSLYRQDLFPSVLKQLTPRNWLMLFLVAVLSGALAPALFFSALELTPVNNIILISRLEPPLALALAVFILGDRVNTWVVAGALLSFLGVALTVLLQAPGAEAMTMMSWQVGTGEFYVIAAAIVSAISAIISKISLDQVSLGLFTTFRMAVGTIVFFAVVLVLFSPSHFMDVFHPRLWQWMLIYSAIIVVGGQLAWFAGLRRSHASEVSLANSVSPIAGILAAYFILGETPNMAQYMGGLVILAGIGLNQYGIMMQQAQPMGQVQDRSLKEADLEAGFKGL